MKNKKGETLIEVIIAVGILALGAITASSLIVSSIRNTVVNHNYLIATNLAREGIEAVRSIRDTNWLRFAYDTPNCWDVVNDEDVISASGDCTNNNVDKFTDSPGINYYRVNINAKNHATAPFKFVLEAKDEFLPTIDPTASKDYLIEPDPNNFNLYRHLNNTSGVVDSGTSFYRGIAIKNETAGGGATTKVRVASTVQWLERGEIKEVIAETILTNYQ